MADTKEILKRKAKLYSLFFTVKIFKKRCKSSGFEPIKQETYNSL